MEVTKGKIVDIDEEGALIRAPLQSIPRALLRKYEYVEVGFPDQRTISLEQRRKAYALMRYVADYTGDDMESNKQMLKLLFLKDNITTLYKSVFSLSNCDVTTAKEFITFLIDFIVIHEIPTDQALVKFCEDIEKYVYTCLKNKKCAVCGRPAELHHIDTIGMGSNRHEVSHIGKMCISLCREHHTESHNIGQESFLSKYHLVGIPMNEELGKIYKLNKKNLGKGDNQ